MLFTLRYYSSFLPPHAHEEIQLTPGGGIHEGEKLEEAVIRVLGEETGLEAFRVEQAGSIAHI